MSGKAYMVYTRFNYYDIHKLDWNAMWQVVQPTGIQSSRFPGFIDNKESNCELGDFKLCEWLFVSLGPVMATETYA